MNKLPRPDAGFTLVEMIVACGISSIVGLMIFLILNAGMVLYAKNTAVNSAHQQARSAIDQMLANIHSAVSIPTQIHADLTPLSNADVISNLPSAGISFQKFEAGPFPVANDAAKTDTSIMLYIPSLGYTPPNRVRLNIPSHKIELDVTSSAALFGYRQFNFAAPLGCAVDISNSGIEGYPGVKYVITAFLTTRVCYAVVGKELRYYPDNDVNNYRVLTYAVTSSSSTPFSVPLQPSGGLANRYVAAVKLATEESSYSNRGYAAVNMFISSLIPYRSRLTVVQ